MMQRLRCEEDGISLIEILVGIVLMVTVMGIAATGAVAAMKTQRRQVAAVEAMNRAKIGMERLTREIRAANPLVSATPNAITVQVTRGAERRTTTYQLTGSDLTASVTTETLSTPVTVVTTPPVTIIRGLQPSAGQVLFRYYKTDGTEAVTLPIDPLAVRRVEITLRIPLPENARPVELTTDVLLRNSRS